MEGSGKKGKNVTKFRNTPAANFGKRKKKSYRDEDYAKILKLLDEGKEDEAREFAEGHMIDDWADAYDRGEFKPGHPEYGDDWDDAEDWIHDRMTEDGVPYYVAIQKAQEVLQPNRKADAFNNVKNSSKRKKKECGGGYATPQEEDDDTHEWVYLPKTEWYETHEKGTQTDPLDDPLNPKKEARSPPAFMLEDGAIRKYDPERADRYMEATELMGVVHAAVVNSAKQNIPVPAELHVKAQDLLEPARARVVKEMARSVPVPKQDVRMETVKKVQVETKFESANRRVRDEKPDPNFCQFWARNQVDPDFPKCWRKGCQYRHAWKYSVKGVAPVKESVMPGSRFLETKGTDVSINLGVGDERHGYLQAELPSNRVWIITHRHGYSGDKEMDAAPVVGAKIVVTCRAGWNQEVEIGQICTEDVNPDRLMILPKWTMPPPPPKTRFGVANVGDVVYMNTYRKRKDGVREWHMAIGKICGVYDRVVAYDLTTEPGSCRAAVYNARGEIVAAHKWGSVEYTCGRYNGGDIETYREIPAVKKMVGYTDQGGGNMQGHKKYEDCLARWPKRTELMKAHHLRGALPRGYATGYVFAKPSTEMVKREVQAFLEPIKVCLNQWQLQVAMKYTCFMDRDASAKFPVRPMQDAVDEIAGKGLAAGPSRWDGTHKQYCTEAGYGFKGVVDPDEAFTLGKQYIAEQLQELVTAIELGHVLDDTQMVMSMRCGQWSALGKRDKYKFKKVQQGRSVQAPTFEFKAVWRAYFKEAGEAWIRQGVHYRAGDDYGRPVPRSLALLYSSALGCAAFDMTGWDRKFPRILLDWFFREYIPSFTCGSAGMKLLDWMHAITTYGELVFTDGDSVIKERGNPSGFPDTLWMNSVSLMVVYNYAIAERIKLIEEIEDPAWLAYRLAVVCQSDLFVEICGDDSRVWAMTPLGMQILDIAGQCKLFLEAMSGWPWEVKVEGVADWSAKEPSPGNFHERAHEAPPFISRGLIVVDDLLWSPLLHVTRALTRLLSYEEGRTQELEDELLEGATATLAHWWVWNHDRKVHVPEGDAFEDQFGVDMAQARHILGLYICDGVAQYTMTHLAKVLDPWRKAEICRWFPGDDTHKEYKAPVRQYVNAVGKSAGMFANRPPVIHFKSGGEIEWTQEKLWFRELSKAPWLMDDLPSDVNVRLERLANIHSGCDQLTMRGDHPEGRILKVDWSELC